MRDAEMCVGRLGRARARGQVEPDRDQLQHRPTFSSPIAEADGTPSMRHLSKACLPDAMAMRWWRAGAD